MNIQEQLKDKTILNERIQKEHEDTLKEKDEKIEGHVKVLEVMKQTMIILRDKLESIFKEIEEKNKQIEEMQNGEKERKQMLCQLV